MPAITCCLCKKSVTRANNASTCAKCVRNFHFKCTNLDTTTVTNILNGTSTQWHCSNCDKSKSKPQLNSSARLSTSNISPRVETVNNFISEQVNNISSAVSALQQEFRSIQEGQTSFTQSLGVIYEKLNTLQDVSVALTNHSARIKALEEDKTLLQASVKDLCNRVDIQDQNSLANSLEITGIPISKSESIPDLVSHISAKLNNKLTKEDILRCHRKRSVPSKHLAATRHPPIIISFKDIQKRNNLLSAFRARRGIKLSEIGFESDNYFFINESLTNIRKKLFYTAKTFQRTNNYKYLWTRNGRIFLKKDDSSGFTQIDLNTDFSTLNVSN